MTDDTTDFLRPRMTSSYDIHIGDIVIATETRCGKGDIGASGWTYDTEYYIKDKEYVVRDVYNNGENIVIDGEDGRMGFSVKDFKKVKSPNEPKKFFYDK